MKRLARFIASVLIGVVAIALWLLSHDTRDLYSSGSMLVLIVLIATLGVIFSRLFLVHPVLGGLGSMTTALLVAMAPFAHEISIHWDLSQSHFQSLVGLLAALVVIPPIVTWLITRRSNQRLERP